MSSTRDLLGFIAGGIIGIVLLPLAVLMRLARWSWQSIDDVWNNR